MERLSNGHPDASGVESVVDTEDILGSGDGHRHQWHVRPNSQPCRTWKGTTWIERSMTRSFRKKTNRPTVVQMGQCAAYRAEGDDIPFDRDHIESREGKVKPAVVTEEIHEGEETNLPSKDSTNQQAIEKREMVGGHDKRRLGKSVVSVYLQTPRDPSHASDQGRYGCPCNPF